MSMFDQLFEKALMASDDVIKSQAGYWFVGCYRSRIDNSQKPSYWMSKDYKVGEGLFESNGQWFKTRVPYVGDSAGRLAVFLSKSTESGVLFRVLGAGSDSQFNGIHPVQILTWSTFEESKYQKSFVDYISQNKNTGISLSIADETVLGLGISNDILVFDEQTGLYISGVSLNQNQEFVRNSILPSESVANDKNITPSSRFFTFDCSKLRYESYSSLDNAFDENDRAIAPFFIKIHQLATMFVVPWGNPQETIKFMTSRFQKSLESILPFLFLVRKDVADFNKEFGCEGDTSRQYLIARALYSLTSQRSYKQLDISSLLNSLQANQGINLGKDDLKRLQALILSDTKCGLAEDVEQYGKEHQWSTTVPSDIYAILWNSSSDDIVWNSADSDNQTYSSPPPSIDNPPGEVIKSLKVGDTIKGRVRGITYYGAFIDLGGFNGLLHISNMSWGRIKHPRELVRVGQEIEVVILEVDLERKRVSLGLKQLQSDPWDGDIESRYPVGSRQHGKVVDIANSGAYIELEPNLDGLVCTNEVCWTGHAADEMPSVGDMVDVVVLGVYRDQHKIDLSIRRTKENPFAKYKAGQRVRGKVRNFTSYGAFIQLEDGTDGLIHVQDMSWTRKIDHPGEMLQKGQDIEAVVLEVTPEEQRMSLGLKQTQDDPWKTVISNFQIGQMVKGKVYKIASFGTFVELEGGVDGLVHFSQISDEHVDRVKDALTPGHEVEANIVKIDREERRIDLKLKEEMHETLIPEISETQFLINSLFPYIKRCGFTYSTQDIIRFHTSVKCGMLTLLGGAPGTGKSSLVELYFRALGGREKNKNEPETFCRIDVNPSWMEPADLLGYKDASGKFQPAGNGFYEFLSGTATNPDGSTSSDNDSDSLRPVCLEEINLACVEHYFSDFIQIISREEGKLSVAGMDTPVIVDNRTRFVGTCNSDETTHSMSLRLLDRCNYIELCMDKTVRKTLYENLFSKSEKPARPLPFIEGERISSSVYNSWRCTNSGKAISVITDAFSVLFPHFEDAGIAPSPRVVSDITAYIHNRPPLDANGDLISEHDDENRLWLAFDECVAQRILSKYRAAPGTITAWNGIKDNLGDRMPLSKGIVESKLKEYGRMTSFASL